MKIAYNFLLFILISLYTFADKIDLDQEGWPRDLTFNKGVITIYQPQIESFAQDKIEARAALAVKIKDKAPVYGAMWFSSRAVTDRDERVVVFDQINVEQLKFPEGDEENIQKLKNTMANKLDGVSVYMSLDRFLASIEHLQDFDDGKEAFNNEAPETARPCWSSSMEIRY
jgi:hypothetical protein